MAAAALKLVIRDLLDLFRLRRAVLSLAGAAGRESARPNRQGKWGSASGAVLGDLCQVWIRSGLLGSKTPGLDLYRGIMVLAHPSIPLLAVVVSIWRCRRGCLRLGPFTLTTGPPRMPSLTVGPALRASI